MKAPAYPKYKPCSVEWLGDVPEHWDVLATRRVSRRIKTGSTPPTSEERYYEDGSVPWFGPGSFDDKITLSEPVKRLNVSAVTDGAARLFRTGATMVVTIGATLGKVSSLPAEGSCNQQITVVEFEERRVFPRYGTYQFKRLEVALRAVAPSATLPILAQNDIAEVFMTLPPFPEQRAIADFLDVETAKLDTLVAKKRELIDKLKEKRTALISRIVTRGLPPEVARAAGLNPNPKLKACGIEWLDEIPEHWESPPLYTRYKIELGKMLDESRITGTLLIPYLRNIDVQWDTINTADLPEMDIRHDEYPRYTLRVGDLLVCEGGEVGRAAIFRESGSVLGFQKALHRLRAIDSTDFSRLLYYTLYWASHFGIFFAEGNPNTIPHLTGEKLRRYRFPKPPLLEQRAIADYLDRETTKIDRMVEKVEAAIERLQEYRTALITAAVTGKIDVREIAA
jgi:type I restriction enzyme S subunit